MTGNPIKQDPFKGEYVFDFNSKKSDTVIGYVGYFRLVNGFEKYLYMTVDEVRNMVKNTAKHIVKVTDYGKMLLTKWR